jgi:hypothetical protein
MGVQDAYRFRRLSGSSVEENRQAGEQSPSAKPFAMHSPCVRFVPFMFLTVLLPCFAMFRNARWRPVYHIEKEEDKTNLNHARPWSMDDLRSPLYLQALARHLPSWDPQFCAF